MNEKVLQLLERAQVWLDERSLRERALVLVTSLVAVYAVGSMTLIDPLESERRQVTKELDMAAERLARAKGRAAEVSRRMAEGPNAALSRRAMRLGTEIDALDEQLGAHRVAIVSPEETARVLEELVGRDAEMRLLRLETLSSEPLLERSNADVSSRSADGELEPDVSLFRHDFTIEAKGSYFAALRYLRAIEALPWRVHLAEFDYSVSEYPNALLRLRLYTLSFEEAWIGV